MGVRPSLSVVTSLTSIHEDAGWIPGLTQWVWRCPELWCRSQPQLRSGIAMAVAQAGSYSSDSAPSLGTSICRGCGTKKRPKKKKTHVFKYSVCSMHFPLVVIIPCKWVCLTVLSWYCSTPAPLTWLLQPPPPGMPFIPPLLRIHSQLLSSTTSSKATPPRFSTDGTHHWTLRTKVLFMALLWWILQLVPPQPFYPLQSAVAATGFHWVWAHLSFLEWGLVQWG